MIRGADYSNWQSQETMVKHLNANPSIRFVMLKASQGSIHTDPEPYTDPTFRVKRTECERRSLLIGQYHYLDDTDGAAQWDHFEQVVRSSSPWAQPANSPYGIFACDYEGELLKTPAKGDAICRAFIARGQARGFKVGKYGSSGVSRKNHGEDWRWAAWWRNTPPPYPWDMWQWTSTPLDLNYAPQKTFGELQHWWARMSAVAPPQQRKVWYIHDPATGETLGPDDYLSVGAHVTRHLRTRPASSRLTIERRS